MRVIILLATYIIISIPDSFGQSKDSPSKIIRKFDYAFSLMVSDDESILAVLTNERNLEFYQIESMKLFQTIKVSRNSWLDKAFFYEGNNIFYFDYGMQINSKFRRMNIDTGETMKVECQAVPMGCSYISLKICNGDNEKLALKSKPYMFKYNLDGHIEMWFNPQK